VVSRSFFLFLFTVSHLFSDIQDLKQEIPLATKKGGLSSIVNDSVSVTTGTLIESSRQFSLQPHADLDFVQNYVAHDWKRNNFPHSEYLFCDTFGWTCNLSSYVLCFREMMGNCEKVFGYYLERGGSNYFYRGHQFCTELCFHYGDKTNKSFLNIGSGIISGQNHPKNSHFSYPKETKKNRYMICGDGSHKVFHFAMRKGDGNKLYTLKEEVRPNGHRLVYEYNKYGYKVKVMNSAKDTEFGWINYTFDKKNKKSPYSSKTVTTSDGRVVRYKTSSYRPENYPYYCPKGYYISEIENPYGESAKYTYRKWSNTESHALLQKKTFSNGFFIHNEYYTPGKNKTSTGTIHLKEPNWLIGKVMQQSSPVGKTKAPIVTHRYVYYGGKDQPGHTDVYDAYSRKTRYLFDKHSRLFRVYKYYKKGGVFRTDECLFTTDGTVKGEMTLISDKWVHSGTCLKYDQNKNVTEETVIGNLTGRDLKIPFCFKETNPHFYKDQMDRLVKKYSYTGDNFNLVKTESAGRVTHHYTYQPKTNLVTKKLTSVDGVIVQREFNRYDKNASLVQKIIDNGSGSECDDLTGVTQRRIQKITPVSEGNGIGLPFVIEERYLDEGEERLLKKTINTYTKEGWIANKEIFDASDAHLYTIHTEYDMKGHPIKWNDAEGNLYSRKYDCMGNLIEEKSPKFTILNTYDHASRLIRRKHSADHAAETFSYDLCGNLIEKTDCYGNTTSITYDDFNRPIQTHNHSTGAIQKTAYDVEDNPTVKIDGNGNKTEIAYTYYKKPYRIKYPDGSVEHYRYNVEGDLIEKIHANGLIIRYEHDPFHRLIKTQTFSPDETLLSEESASYNAFHKTSETNAEGITTYYFYDGAGRLIEKRQDHPLEQYTYGPNGEVAEKRIYTSPTSFYTEAYTYGLNGKKIEEKTLNQNGDVQRIKRFTFDSLGNLTSKTTLINGVESTITFEYDGKSRLIASTDPMGNQTLYRYTRDHETIEINPKGVQTIKKFNADGNEIELAVLDPFGQEVKKAQKEYDLAGNLVEETHLVYSGYEVIKTITNSWEVDSQNRVIAVSEAAGTDEQKITRYVYNDQGEKEATIKPDGTRICYTYTPEGYLESLQSHDIHYTYTYDKLGNPVQIVDHIHERINSRVYDHNSQLIQETIGNELSIQIERDWIGRVLTIKAPLKPESHYQYDGVNLVSVENNGDTHRYEYDQSGYVTKSITPKGIEIATERDVIGRIVNFCSSEASYENLRYDETHNLIGAKINGREVGYTYDALEQLTSENDTAYTYDSLNNRLTRDEETYEYNHLNQLKDHDYDLNGNPRKMEGFDLEYDSLNRLVRAANDKYTIEYTYDSFDRCIVKYNVGKVLYRFLYQEEEEIGSYSHNQNLDFRVLGKGRGAEIGAAVIVDQQSERYFPFHDHLGSIVRLTSDRLSLPLNRLVEYSAFGEQRWKNRLSWTYMGKREDKVTGWINFGKRFYLPKKGRFLTPDPIGFDGGINLYAYCRNRPLHFIDLRGENPVMHGFSMVGYMIETIGNHCIPLPYVSNIVGAAGRFFQGKGLQWNPDWYHPSCVTTVGEKKVDGHEKVVSNGILTTYENAMEQAKTISDMYNNEVVHVNYNATHGFSLDLVNCCLQKLGFDLSYVNQTRELLTTLSERIGEQGTVLCINHSRGVDTFYRATWGMKLQHQKCIETINLGGAKIIPKGNFKDVRNYIAKSDPIPQIGSPINYLSVLYIHHFTDNEVNVTFVDTKTPLDHFIGGEAYNSVLEEESTRYREKSGII